MMAETLTVGVVEGARLLGVGQHALRSAIRAGSVRVLRLGRKVRVPRVELEELARNPERFIREKEAEE